VARQRRSTTSQPRQSEETARGKKAAPSKKKVKSRRTSRLDDDVKDIDAINLPFFFFLLLSLPYLADLGILLISRLDLDVVRKHDAKRGKREKRKRLPPFSEKKKNAGRNERRAARFSLSLFLFPSAGRDAREREALGGAL